MRKKITRLNKIILHYFYIVYLVFEMADYNTIYNFIEFIIIISNLVTLNKKKIIHSSILFYFFFFIEKRIIEKAINVF